MVFHRHGLCGGLLAGWQGVLGVLVDFACRRQLWADLMSKWVERGLFLIIILGEFGKGRALFGMALPQSSG
jgi:hypothetical protein